MFGVTMLGGFAEECVVEHSVRIYYFLCSQFPTQLKNVMHE